MMVIIFFVYKLTSEIKLLEKIDKQGADRAKTNKMIIRLGILPCAQIIYST